MLMDGDGDGDVWREYGILEGTWLVNIMRIQ